jgi:hypothetical protein
VNQTIYLVCSRRGGVTGIRKSPPALGTGQIAIKLTVVIPDAVFAEYIPAAVIEVAPQQVQYPPVTVEVQPPDAPQEADHAA